MGSEHISKINRGNLILNPDVSTCDINQHIIQILKVGYIVSDVGF